jgi:BirA family biotin operon repressor/biotin-[acetyl-CoA-carboxylase] ligase
MAALAVRDALEETVGLETDIKWPNDIMGDGRKLCGILAETIETDTGRAAILGIGINLDEHAFPLDLEGIATSVTELTGEKPNRQRLVQALVSAIEGRYKTLQAVSGKEETIDAWTRHSSYADGRHVRVATGAEVFEGVTRGLEPDGALRVETDIGELRTVHAGDVSSLRESNVQGPKFKV